MQIGANLLYLVPGAVGGSEHLATGILRELSKMAAVVVFGVKGFGQAHPELARKCEIVEAPWSGSAQPLRVAAENTWLAMRSRSLKLDVTHHWGGTIPWVARDRGAATIHDIQYMHYPNNFSLLRRTWLRSTVPRAARAQLVAVPSEFVKQDLVGRLHADPNRIVLIPFGIDGLFPSSDGIDEVRRAYGLKRPYFLYPARSYPHKNHKMLINAFARVAPRADLVLTGAPWSNDKTIKQTISSAGLTNSIHHLVGVPREHLAGLYLGALALVYPTKFEGFGAPLVEAMSMGKPIISSDSTCLPEVLGNGGVLLSPEDGESWSAKMNELIDSPQLVSALSDKSRSRAGNFSWKKSAETLMQAYSRMK